MREVLTAVVGQYEAGEVHGHFGGTWNIDCRLARKNKSGRRGKRSLAALVVESKTGRSGGSTAISDGFERIRDRTGQNPVWVVRPAEGACRDDRNESEKGTSGQANFAAKAALAPARLASDDPRAWLRRAAASALASFRLGHFDQDRERARKAFFRTNRRHFDNDVSLAHGSTFTLSEDQSQLVAGKSRRRLEMLSVRFQTPRLARVELIHRLRGPSNLNSRDENDGIESVPDRFD
jgi:hypothetical protein